MRLGVTVHRREKWAELPDQDVECALRTALSHLNMESRDYSVGVVLTNDREVQDLNCKHRGKNQPTNVLAFPTHDHLGYWEVKECSLGDLILSKNRVEEEARQQRKRVQFHAIHLLVHGILHLVGYDHIEETAAAEMEGTEVEILQKMGVPNPYA